jgi:hypothetical protein
MLTMTRAAERKRREAVQHARRDDATYGPDRVSKAEIAVRHAKEVSARILLDVQELEQRLAIPTRWRMGSPEWEAAVMQLHRRKYQKAVDALELLVVQRLLELTKMNRSGLGTYLALWCISSTDDHFNFR